MKLTLRSTAVLPAVLLLGACDGTLLEEEVYSDLGPSNFFRTEQDAAALLNSAYDIEQRYDHMGHEFTFAEMTTDLAIQRGGGQRRRVQPIEDFTWDATHSSLSRLWERAYRAIYRTNLAIERIPEMTFNQSRKQRMVAEARFIRAESYLILYQTFGPVPLITSSEADPQDQPARATEEEMETFIETELRAVADVLPTVAAQYPRATKGAALGFLARFHLNQKEWQEVVDVTGEIMNMGMYSLFQGEDRTDLFAVENERNAEFIHVRPFVTNVRGNTWITRAAPPRYQFKAPPKTNWATQFKLLTPFVESFHPEDQRRDAIITEYVNTKGELVKLGKDNARSFKFKEDLAASGNNAGNDFPVIRYADVLLMRAEALNELRGPNQESIDLINRVRTAADAPPIRLSDFPSKQALRDHILAERAWEFHSEGLRRLDLIRHGKFIELAQQRGKGAQPHHVIFPLPQSELDKNPNLVQNPGY